LHLLVCHISVPRRVSGTYLAAGQKRSGLEGASLRVQSMAFRFWLTVSTVR
jgi:hypothetical protein